MKTNKLVTTLRNLELRIKNVTSNVCDSSIDSANHRSTLVQFFKLAALIYLKKATGTHYNDIEHYVSEGIEIASKLDSCEALLPLFLIGSEARSDCHRLVVLDLIARTPKSVLRDSALSKIQCVWTQNDFSNDKNPDYLGIISATISQCTIMTSFL